MKFIQIDGADQIVMQADTKLWTSSCKRAKPVDAWIKDCKDE